MVRLLSVVWTAKTARRGYGRPRPTPLQIALSRSGRNWFHKRLVPHNDYLRGVSR